MLYYIILYIKYIYIYIYLYIHIHKIIMKISDLPSLDLSYGDKEDIISLQDNS